MKLNLESDLYLKMLKCYITPRCPVTHPHSLSHSLTDTRSLASVDSVVMHLSCNNINSGVPEATIEMS